MQKFPDQGNLLVMTYTGKPDSEADETNIALGWLQHLFSEVGWKPGEFAIKEIPSRELLRVSRHGYEAVFFDIDALAEAAYGDTRRVREFEKELKRMHSYQRSAPSVGS